MEAFQGCIQTLSSITASKDSDWSKYEPKDDDARVVQYSVMATSVFGAPPRHPQVHEPTFTESRSHELPNALSILPAFNM